jgi:hypothetical protein
MGIGSLYRRVERPELGVIHPHSSSDEVKERLELFLYSPIWAFVDFSMVNFTLTFTFTFTRSVLVLC